MPAAAAFLKYLHGKHFRRKGFYFLRVGWTGHTEWTDVWAEPRTSSRGEQEESGCLSMVFRTGTGKRKRSWM